MKKSLSFAFLAAALVAAGCNGGEPQGDIPAPGVKVAKPGEQTGPSTTASPTAAPITQPGGEKPATE